MTGSLLLLVISAEPVDSVDFVEHGSTLICAVELPHVLVTRLQMLPWLAIDVSVTLKVINLRWDVRFSESDSLFDDTESSYSSLWISDSFLCVQCIYLLSSVSSACVSAVCGQCVKQCEHLALLLAPTLLANYHTAFRKEDIVCVSVCVGLCVSVQHESYPHRMLM